MGPFLLSRPAKTGQSGMRSFLAHSPKERSSSEIHPLRELSSTSKLPACSTDEVIRWREEKLIPVSRAMAGIAMLHGNVCIAGGTRWQHGTKIWLDLVDCYSIDTDSWAAGPRLPQPVADGCYASTEAGFEILGGFDGKASVRDSWVLAPDSTQWRRLPAVPQSIIYGAAEAWNGSLFLFGGCRDDSNLASTNDDVWMRGADQRWNRVSVVPQAGLLLFAHACVGDRIYLFGGCSAPGGKLANSSGVFCFDCKSHAWKRLKNLPQAMRGACAVPLDQSHIAILGGYGETFLSTVLLYDIRLDRFTQISPLPKAFLSGLFLLHEGTIFGGGGEDAPESRMANFFAGQLCAVHASQSSHG